MQVCVLQDGQLQTVDATFLPATRDTVVMMAGAEQPFSQAYPGMGADYAAGADWYVNNEPITMMNRRYVRFGLTRDMPCADLERIGEYRGVPIFAEQGGARPPEVVYAPVGPGGLFQPYNYEPRVRGVRG